MNKEVEKLGQWEIFGDGFVLFCEWCKATQPYLPEDCDICFTTQTLPVIPLAEESKE